MYDNTARVGVANLIADAWVNVYDAKKALTYITRSARWLGQVELVAAVHDNSAVR